MDGPSRTNQGSVLVQRPSPRQPLTWEDPAERVWDGGSEFQQKAQVSKRREVCGFVQRLGRDGW